MEKFNKLGSRMHADQSSDLVDPNACFERMLAVARSTYGKLLLDVVFTTTRGEENHDKFRSEYTGVWQASEHDQNYVQAHEFAAGWMSTFRHNTTGEVGCVVFLKKEDGDDYVSKIPILAHELGHVDDVKHKYHLNPDKAVVDLEKAELYAHKFACEKLLEIRSLVGLCYYVNHIVEELVKSPSDPIAKAAISFKKTKLFHRCRKETFHYSKLFD
jgi:hypothetical protein